MRQADHLGNVLTEMGNMEQDASVKRASFIRSSSEIREMFKHAAPQEVIKALKIYCTSFYGSSLWDLNSVKARQMYSAWDYSVKLVWNCPPWTRTYFVQQLLCCGFTSARVDIQRRFVTFYQSLKSSASYEVQVMARFLGEDIQSMTSLNLRHIEVSAGHNPWNPSRRKIKNALKFCLNLLRYHQDTASL